MAFWQVLFLLGAFGALFVVWPLVKAPFTSKSRSLGVQRDDTQVELYQEHLEDLEKVKALGEIDDKQFEELKLELQKNLLADGQTESTGDYKLDGKKVILGLAIAVPIISVILYTQLGAKKDWDIYQSLNELPKSSSREDYDNKLRSLAIDVQARLNHTPNNMPLLNLLGQTSMALQDYDQAERAYRKILEKFPESPGLIASLAQAMFYRAGNNVTPEVLGYVEKALSMAPMLPEMHGLAGIDAKNKGDLRGAVRHWKLAVQSMDPSSQVAQGYLSGIANAEAALTAAGESTAGATTEVKAADVAAVESASVSLTVVLAKDVKVNPTDTLFVYARAWKGAKIPLAIKRLTVADLPLSIKLDESMAMAPGMTITSFPELEVIARVSRSGSPAAQTGDWQASAGPIKLSELKGPINLTIADQVP